MNRFKSSRYIALIKKSLNKRFLRKKRNKKYNIIILSFLIISIILFIIYFIFHHFNIEKNIYNYTNYKKKFNNILPKISLENNKAPSLEEIFNSRTLYISDANLTGEYIRYIRPINETEEEKYKKKYSEEETKISPKIFTKRKDQYDFKEFAKLCLDEKLIDSNEIKYDNKPIISVVLPSYNKEDVLLKSIRSIQNQNFKNIEIIIVNDCSTDNSKKVFEYLLETDPRIRIFHHLKNMGCWRTRLDGILYSRGKYVILFDSDDLYEDNYVLEDAFNIMEKYNLDSSKFLFRIIRSYKKYYESSVFFHVRENSKIIYGPINIKNFNSFVFKTWGNIWNRLTRANIFIKGIYLLNDIVLNLYKNVWDDLWFNSIINRASYSYLIYERVGYIYMQNGAGEGSPRKDTDKNKDKYIQEFLEFLYFDYNMLPKDDNKGSIIKVLKKYNDDKSNPKLSYLKSNFYLIYNLINILIEDPYVSNTDKIFLNEILAKTKEREKNISQTN